MQVLPLTVSVPPALIVSVLLALLKDATTLPETVALQVGAPVTEILQLSLVIDSGVMPLTVVPVAVSTAVLVHAIVIPRPPGFLHPVNASCMSVLMVGELAQVPVNDPAVQDAPANVTAPVAPDLAPGGVTVAPAATASAANDVATAATVAIRVDAPRKTAS